MGVLNEGMKCCTEYAFHAGAPSRFVPDAGKHLQNVGDYPGTVLWCDLIERVDADGMFTVCCVKVDDVFVAASAHDTISVCSTILRASPAHRASPVRPRQGRHQFFGRRANGIYEAKASTTLRVGKSELFQKIAFACSGASQDVEVLI